MVRRFKWWMRAAIATFLLLTSAMAAAAQTTPRGLNEWIGDASLACTLVWR
jgi:hypothetical protein